MSEPTTLAGIAPAPRATQALLRRLDVPGPRQASGPTADRCVDAFDRHLRAAAGRGHFSRVP